MASRITFGDSTYNCWYSYIEDGVFVIGRHHLLYGGDCYRGEYKGDDTPYLNEIKKSYPKMYNKIIKYFEKHNI